MTWDCRKCPDYEYCEETCDKVHAYIMGDQISRREYISPKIDMAELCTQDYKEVLNSLMNDERLKGLSEMERQVIIMHVCNISGVRIAQVMNITETMVSRVIARFKDKKKAHHV